MICENKYKEKGCVEQNWKTEERDCAHYEMDKGTCTQRARNGFL